MPETRRPAMAEANSGEKKRGPSALVGEEAWEEAGEVRRDSGHA